MYALSGLEVKYPEIFIKIVSVFGDFEVVVKEQTSLIMVFFLFVLQYLNAIGTGITRTSQGLQIGSNCQNRNPDTRDIHKNTVDNG